MTQISDGVQRALPTTAYVGERVHQHMWRQRISQVQASHSVGVNQSTLSKKIRGLVPFTVDELIALADLLGVDPAELLPGREDVVRHQGLEPRTRCFEVIAGHSVAGVIDLDGRRARQQTSPAA